MSTDNLLKQVEDLADFRREIIKKRQKATVDMNDAICKAYEGGVVMPVLAKATGLTVGRISQIISDQK